MTGGPGDVLSRLRLTALGARGCFWVDAARAKPAPAPSGCRLGAPSEGYRLEMLNGDTLVRHVTVSSPSYVYSVADQVIDFGAPPALLRVRVAQLDGAGAPGLQSDVSMPL